MTSENEFLIKSLLNEVYHGTDSIDKVYTDLKNEELYNAHNIIMTYTYNYLFAYDEETNKSYGEISSFKSTER
jgi:hypothetical protein